MARFVALLRGINVGGKNILKMADLRDAFEGLGFGRVETYIQSGNVVFDAKPAARARLAATLERGLSDAFGYSSRVAVLSAEELARVVEEAPPGFGDEPKKYRADVLFALPPLAPAEALPRVPTRPGVDEAWAGSRALYFRRLIARAAQSRLARITQLPLYQQLTIRNWSTTTKLLQLVRA